MIDLTDSATAKALSKIGIGKASKRQFVATAQITPLEDVKTAVRSALTNYLFNTPSEDLDLNIVDGMIQSTVIRDHLFSQHKDHFKQRLLQDITFRGVMQDVLAKASQPAYRQYDLLREYISQTNNMLNAPLTWGPVQNREEQDKELELHDYPDLRTAFARHVAFTGGDLAFTREQWISFGVKEAVGMDWFVYVAGVYLKPRADD